MTAKEEPSKAIVHIRQSWIDATGASSIFKSANMVAGRGEILGIPATQLDISDRNFVEFTFYPRALERERFKSLKVFVPKEAVALIVEPKVQRELAYWDTRQPTYSPQASPGMRGIPCETTSFSISRTSVSLVCGEVATGEEAVERARQLKPDWGSCVRTEPSLQR